CTLVSQVVRRARSTEFDRFPMWSVPVGIRPRLLAGEKSLPVTQALFRNEPFESRQPVFVVTRAVIGLTSIGGRLQFVSKRGGPFFPGEVALLGKFHSHRECLGLPRFSKHRAVCITRQAGE